MRFIFLTFLIFSLSTSLHAQDYADSGLPKAYTCDFQIGVFTSYEDGKFVREENDPFSITFAALDWENGTAQMIGNLGASDLIVSTGQWHVNFIEFTETGSINLTTIFFGQWLEGDRLAPQPAVHSRHLVFEDLPLISQYYGHCLPKY